MISNWILISSPLWLESWLVPVFSACLIALVVIYYHRRLQHIQKQNNRLNLQVDKQSSELKKLNKNLEKKKLEVNQQSEELISQRENMTRANLKLKENQKHIRQQNTELEKHQNKLEELVQKRTAELEEAKLNAEASERLKMAFLSNMSHEIRTPMNAIIGFASLLIDETIDAAEKEDYIKQININGESLLILIDDILDLSKIEANQLDIKIEGFEVNAFIDDIIFTWQQQELKTNGRIKLEIKNKLPKRRFSIRSDRVRILQILNNLLDNAFKFTPSGVISLHIGYSNHELRFNVIDSGIGIPKESMEYIFDRFRKGTDTGAKLYRGAGLGLTISKKLAQLLNGNLQVTSTVGKGSDFCLALKVKEEPAASNIKKNQLDNQYLEEISFPDKKILIVEDEENNYLFLKGLLSRKKAILTWAKNGKEAVDLVLQNKFDLILMDIKMPVMNGLEATKLIRKENFNIKIVAQTAFARPDEEQKIRNAGFDDYLSKPLKKMDLLRVLQKHLNKA